MTGEYDALVYDLDGTLVRLNVDWKEVTKDAAAVLAAQGVETEGMDLWDVLTRAEELGYRDRIEETIAEHERAGARTSRRLPLAETLPADVPVAVCSLNAEGACRIALEVHDIDGHVQTVVGRDTVAGHKPDPEPLLASIEGLSADPARTLFVGDTERDEQTAKRANVPFQYVSDRLGD